MSQRWIAKRTGGPFLHWNLPLREAAPTDELSGSGSLQCHLSPEQLGLAGLLDSWGTELYLEQSGEIRWGGLVVDSGWDGPRWAIEAAGFTSYPHEQPFDATFEAVDADPADITRAIWQHLQGYPDGDLGMKVVGSTSARVGIAATEAKPDGPYRLNWWDNPDCGREIQQLATEAPFEWVEHHRWNADKSAIIHEMRIADRIGRRADDLRFTQGENVAVVPFDQDGDDYASEVVLLGRGEGKAALRARVATRVSGRLRRARLIDSWKDVGSQSRLNTLARAEHQRRTRRLSTAQIIVFNHEHAPFGSFGPGDEIRIDADPAWLAKTSVWQRIVARQRLSPTKMLLDLEPTER